MIFGNLNSRQFWEIYSQFILLLKTIHQLKMFFKLFLLTIALQAALISARIYDRCTLAKDLRYKFNFPREQIPTWICIVQHESNFDTAAMNTASFDHGLFQISQLYWCDPVKKASYAGCHVTCDSLRDDDIRNDVACIKQIFNEFQGREGNGFKAWTTYQYCRGDNSKYVRGCNY